MARPVIISCAVTGSGDTVAKNPAVPVTPAEIAASAVAAAEAGAAIVHLHVRDPVTTRPSMAFELYEETVSRIAASGTDVIVNLTTGAGGRYIPDAEDPCRPAAGTLFRTPAERIAHVERLKPPICSLDMGTMNMGDWVFANTPRHLEEMAAAIRAAGVRPELEVFEAGHVRLARAFLDRGLIERPPLFQLCLGVSWGQPATSEAMLYMRDMLPDDANWFAFGVAAAQFPMVAQAILLGGHVRVGLEDNLYLSRGVLAPSNAALVGKAREIVEVLGQRVATPAEAREILRLG